MKEYEDKEMSGKENSLRRRTDIDLNRDNNYLSNKYLPHYSSRKRLG